MASCFPDKKLEIEVRDRRERLGGGGGLAPRLGGSAFQRTGAFERADWGQPPRPGLDCAGRPADAGAGAGVAESGGAVRGVGRDADAAHPHDVGRCPPPPPLSRQPCERVTLAISRESDVRLPPPPPAARQRAKSSKSGGGGGRALRWHASVPEAPRATARL